MSEVRITCTDAHHDGKELTLHRFKEGAKGWEEVFGSQRPGVDFVFPNHTATVHLVGGDVVMSDWRDPQPDPESVRIKYNLKCRACGDNLPVTRANLDPVLDRLAKAGEQNISLRVIRAIVSK